VSTSHLLFTLFPEVSQADIRNQKRIRLIVKLIVYISLTTGLLLTAAGLFAEETNRSGIYNVLDFGAKGDGSTDDTASVQKAVDTCAAFGGGQVLLPGGKTFLTGAITLGNGVDFHLSANARCP
jgi:Pectate lyase superfamily protein